VKRHEYNDERMAMQWVRRMFFQRVVGAAYPPGWIRYSDSISGSTVAMLADCSLRNKRRQV
jgi:hypothetical protein